MQGAKKSPQRNTLLATSTTDTPQSIYAQATKRSAVLENQLSHNSTAYSWYEGTNDIGTCLFTGNAYHNIVPKIGYFHACGPLGVTFRDLVLQVQMTIIKGDAGGITFRWDAKGYYDFFIGQDGAYELTIGSTLAILKAGSSSAVKVGPKQSNLIAVSAHGNTIDLFVNKQYVTSVNDSTYNEGYIGVVAHAISNPTEVAFLNAQVWTL